jgi:hypothetical protein
MHNGTRKFWNCSGRHTWLFSCHYGFQAISLNTDFICMFEVETNWQWSSLERTVQFGAISKNIIPSARAADLFSPALSLSFYLLPLFYMVSVFPFSTQFSRGYGSMGDSGRVVEFCGEEDRVP